MRPLQMGPAGPTEFYAFPIAASLVLPQTEELPLKRTAVVNPLFCAFGASAAQFLRVSPWAPLCEHRFAGTNGGLIERQAF